MAGSRGRIFVVLAVAALLVGCRDGDGQVECRDGTSYPREAKGSVICIQHGGEKWTGDW